MKQFLLLILGLLLTLLLIGCTADTPSGDTGTPTEAEKNADTALPGFAVEGLYLRVGAKHYIILSEESRAVLGDTYLVLACPPWVAPVDFDALSDGDRIKAKGMTIADLTPRVLDVEEIELVERGTVDTIDPSIVQELIPTECELPMEIARITDTSRSSDIDLPDVEEPFYEDRQYVYIFGNPISEYVIVTYSDGTQENVKEALERGHIALFDLDRFGIQYFSEPKLIEDIVYHADQGGEPDALEYFHSDETYLYYFPSIRSHVVIVYFKDGSEMPICEALAADSVKIRDLDWFGIEYYKVEQN